MKILPYGEDGTYIDLGVADAPDRAARTVALAAALRARFPGTDVVTGVGVVAVFDAPFADVASAAREVYTRGDVYTSPALASAAPPAGAAGQGGAPGGMCTHRIEVVYDGPDLEDVAARLGVAASRVIDLHAGAEVTVEVVGFLPGFAYMGPIDARLIVPRRGAPRPRVDAQSVAIAGPFTGIYPLSSPGGWNLLGTSLGPLPFDPSRARPFLFAAGDRVQFVPVSRRDEPRGGAAVGMEVVRYSGPECSRGAAAFPRKIEGEPSRPRGGLDVAREKAPKNEGGPSEYQSGIPDHLTEPARESLPGAPNRRPCEAWLRIVRCAGIATLQDGGRRGLLASGMPASGPLDPARFLAANLAVGNPPDAAVIELVAGCLTVRAEGAPLFFSVDGAPARQLPRETEARIAGEDRPPHYIALAGGIDVPRVLGARATFLTARIGGLDGRALRRGDLLPVAPEAPAAIADSPPLLAPPAPAAPRALEALVIDRGPHADRLPPSALDALLRTEWRLSRLTDRTGARLEGPPVPREGPDLAGPVPMRRGAIQITTDGTPILLGPDHPTTGGYPVLATLRPASFSALARLIPGDPLRFTLTP